MGTNELRWRGVARASAICACAATLASCTGYGPVTPAPVEIRGAPTGTGTIAGPVPELLPSRSQPAPRAANYLTVRPGQSLGGIAHSYHVPAREIIAANHLKPPYKIEIGARLLIPGDSAPVPETATEHTVAPNVATERVASRPRDVIPLDGPAPSKLGATPPPASSAAAAVAAEVARESERPSRTEPPPAGVKARFLGKHEEVEHADAALHGGRFPWPVQGRVVGNYGSGAGGAHNDGVNIAAARGTPIRAIEGGVVAYAGNELRGYGNLVLVKHPDGLISAYAHCDELLVKKGDKIGSGQVIGRVGSSGGVSEPQLHFELRRGKRPVDPREFLGPAPSAGTAASAG